MEERLAHKARRQRAVAQGSIDLQPSRLLSEAELTNAMIVMSAEIRKLVESVNRLLNHLEP